MAGDFEGLLLIWKRRLGTFGSNLEEKIPKRLCRAICLDDKLILGMIQVSYYATQGRKLTGSKDEVGSMSGRDWEFGVNVLLYTIPSRCEILALGTCQGLSLSLVSFRWFLGDFCLSLLLNSWVAVAIDWFIHLEESDC